VIVDYVARCNADFYAAEVEHGRQRSEPEDCRVDVCLYFVAAHRLKPVDVQFIAALAPHVALIPIIAKVTPHTTPLSSLANANAKSAEEMYQRNDVVNRGAMKCVASIFGNLVGWMLTRLIQCFDTGMIPGGHY
jgi:hypothetical protein